MSNVLSKTMFELREMNEEIIALRAELRAVKDRFKGGNEQPQEQKEGNKEGEIFCWGYVEAAAGSTRETRRYA